MSSIYLVDYYSNKKGFFQSLSAVSKLIFFALSLFSIVFSEDYRITILVFSVLLIFSIFGELPIKKMLKWALLPVFFALIFAISQPDTFFVRTLTRAFVAAYLAIFYSFTTSYRDSFALFGKVFPFLSVFFFLTYRYFFILIGDLEKKIKTLKVRGSGKRKLKTAGYMMGYFVVDSMNKSEKIYRILKVRGFRGRIYSKNDFSFSYRDLLLVIVGILIFLINFN